LKPASEPFHHRSLASAAECQVADADNWDIRTMRLCRVTIESLIAPIDDECVRHFSAAQHAASGGCQDSAAAPADKISKLRRAEHLKVAALKGLDVKAQGAALGKSSVVSLEALKGRNAKHNDVALFQSLFTIVLVFPGLRPGLSYPALSGL
jgi:hypothetical protein